MSLLSIIGTGAAWLNYDKAKREYNELLERKDVLITAIGTYQQYADKLAEETKQRIQQQILEEKEQGVESVDNPSELLVTSIMRVGNLVGNYYKAQCVLVVSNVSDHDYYISGEEMECYFNNVVFCTGVNSENRDIEKKNWIKIPSGKTIEIGFAKQTYRDNGRLEDLRQHICDYCGKNLITSCPRVSIDDMSETAKIYFKWSVNPDPEKENVKIASYRGVPGVLRYSGVIA